MFWTASKFSPPPPPEEQLPLPTAKKESGREWVGRKRWWSIIKKEQMNELVVTLTPFKPSSAMQLPTSISSQSCHLRSRHHLKKSNCHHLYFGADWSIEITVSLPLLELETIEKFLECAVVKLAKGPSGTVQSTRKFRKQPDWQGFSWSTDQELFVFWGSKHQGTTAAEWLPIDVNVWPRSQKLFCRL